MHNRASGMVVKPLPEPSAMKRASGQAEGAAPGMWRTRRRSARTPRHENRRPLRYLVFPHPRRASSSRLLPIQPRQFAPFGAQVFRNPPAAPPSPVGCAGATCCGHGRHAVDHRLRGIGHGGNDGNRPVHAYRTNRPAAVLLTHQRIGGTGRYSPRVSQCCWIESRQCLRRMLILYTP